MDLKKCWHHSWAKWRPIPCFIDYSRWAGRELPELKLKIIFIVISMNVYWNKISTCCNLHIAGGWKVCCILMAQFNLWIHNKVLVLSKWIDLDILICCEYLDVVDVECNRMIGGFLFFLFWFVFCFWLFGPKVSISCA
jgi:hypothetical protein